MGNQPDTDTQARAHLDLHLFISYFQYYNQIHFISPNGDELIRVDKPLDRMSIIVPDDQLQNKSHRYYLSALQQMQPDQLYMSPLDLNVEHGKIVEPFQPVIRIGTPVYGEDGQYKGALLLNYRAKELLNDLRSFNTDNKDRQVWLLNEKGYWLLGPTPEDEWGFMQHTDEQRGFQFSNALVWRKMLTMLSQRSSSKNADGLFTYARIQSDDFLPTVNDQTWYVLTYTAQRYFNNQAGSLLHNIYLFYGFTLTLTGLFSWLIARKETERIQSEHKLRESENQYRNLLEGAPDAIVIVNRSGRIQLVNTAAERVFGYERGALMNRPIEMLLSERFQTQHVKHRQGYVDQPTVRPMGESQELFAQHQDGSEIPVEISLSPFRQGDDMLVTAVIRDVSVRKQREHQFQNLNHSLIKRTIELEDVNGELDAFSYSVSHDLRAPLRAIDGFSHALLKEYGTQLDERGRDRLTRVRSATQRMGVLIDDLLALSRISRTEINRENVDVTQLASKIAQELQQSDPKRGVVFDIQSALKAYADARLLSIVLMNLMSNAWKFTGRNNNDARIEMRGNWESGKYVYRVSDNGAGFDMTYVDKLFMAFQRLHNASEFPGTGVGLATVQRVVRKHGGRVWADSEVGKGSNFYFTLEPEE
ncbi:MAG: PAS domain S-box protein [Gammaproteobacteria bacterium]